MTGYVMKGERRARGSQRGQALVFVTIVMLVMALALLTMYSMGQLATEKMKLQNTADAAAYSAAVAQARDYNFSAYTNRAMVANQVAVAQLVGLASWARNYDDTFRTLIPQVSWMATGAVAGFTWSPLVSFLKPVASGFKSAVDATAKVAVPVLGGIIDVLGYGQAVYHYGTAVTVAQQLGVVGSMFNSVSSLTGLDMSGLSSLLSFLSADSVIAKNDPNAQLSALGVLAYAYNTYQWISFTEMKDPTTSGKDGSHSERFAKVTTSSMDGFYDVRTRPWVPFPWPLPSVLVDPSYFCCTPNVYGFTMLLFHNGGTELRNNNKTWSAMDVTSFFGLVTIPIYIPPFGPFLNLPILPWVVPPFGAPAGGAAQAGTSNSISPSGNFNRDDPASPRGADSYGKSYESNAIAAAIQAGKGAGSVLGKGPSSSGGLRKYMDVKDVAQASSSAHQDSNAPAIVVEIEKPSNVIGTAASGNLRIGRAGSTEAGSYCSFSAASRTVPAVTSPFANTGSLDVGDGTAGNCMRALSKAEAYFSRPTDLFPRDNSNETEFGSLYSPYWQARLLPNSLLEQGASLVFQGLSSTLAALGSSPW
jgi:Flp pilus assembly protein TadG